MKNLSRPKIKKWLNVLIAVLFVSLVYKLYELDIQAWSCDEEQNTGSCLLAARIYEEAGNLSMTEKYLRSSCNGEYPLGCFELGNHLIQKGQREEGRKLLIQSCELGHKPACL